MYVDVSYVGPGGDIDYISHLNLITSLSTSL